MELKIRSSTLRGRRTIAWLRLPLCLCAAAALCAHCSAPSAPLAGSNVLLIVVDALAADHLGCYGYQKETSPFIDSMARRSVLFESLVSTASHTVPATASLWASAYPSRHGNQYYPHTRSFRRPEPGLRPMLPESLPLMAELFRASGYRTAAVTANPWLRSRYGFDRGFDQFHFLPSEVEDPRGRYVNALARQFLRERSDAPFFLYLHYMDVHNPYQPPSPYRERFTAGLLGRNLRSNGPMPEASPQDVAATRALYDGEIRGLDDLMRSLHAELQASGVADSTLVVFTADHGEEFHQHGGMGHGWTLFEESLHVPLFFLHPKIAPYARRIAGPVSNVDLLPTLLELVGAGVPEGLDGVSLAGEIFSDATTAPAQRILFSELGEVKAARLGHHKLVASRQQGGAHQAGTTAFDLRDDPGEQHAISEAPAWQPKLEAALARLQRVSREASERSSKEPGPIEAEVSEEWFEEQLRALGYLE